MSNKNKEQANMKKAQESTNASEAQENTNASEAQESANASEAQESTNASEAQESADVTTIVIVNEAEIDAIIRKRVYIAMGIGLVPIPLVDFVAISALQLEMINALCKKYDIPFKKAWVKSSISALAGGAVTVGAIPLISSIAKSIPVIGYTLGATSVIISGAASTYAIGKVFNCHFKKGGNLSNLDVEEYKAYFAEKFQKGKEYVKSIRVKKDSGIDKTDAPAA